MTRRDGLSWFKASTGSYGITWVRDNPDGHYKAEEAAS